MVDGKHQDKYEQKGSVIKHDKIIGGKDVILANFHTYLWVLKWCYLQNTMGAADEDRIDISLEDLWGKILHLILILKK